MCAPAYGARLLLVQQWCEHVRHCMNQHRQVPVPHLSWASPCCWLLRCSPCSSTSRRACLLLCSFCLPCCLLLLPLYLPLELPRPEVCLLLGCGQLPEALHGAVHLQAAAAGRSVAQHAQGQAGCSERQSSSPRHPGPTCGTAGQQQCKPCLLHASITAAQHGHITA